MKIFSNRKFTIIFSLCAVVLLVLALWLTTLVVQKNSFEKKIEQLKEEIAVAEEEITDIEKQLQFKETWEYVVQYAEENNLLTEDELRWVKSSMGE